MAKKKIKKDYFIRLDIIHSPKAPLFITDWEFLSSIPPIANIGIFNTDDRFSTNFSPLGSKPFLQSVLNICPATT